MTDFASTGPTPGDLCYRTSTGGDPQAFIGIKAGNPVGTYYGILAANFLTDNQIVELALADQGVYSGSATTIYTHCDSGHTVGAYCRIFNNKIEVGSYTRSGGSYTFTPFAGGTWNSTVGARRVKFLNSGTTWNVFVNQVAVGDRPVLSVVNASVTFDASHRSAAISMDRQHASSPFGSYPVGDYDSYRVGAITMSDLVSPTYQGSGAKITKTDNLTAAVTAANALMPSGYFNTVDSNTADITVDATHAKFTVSIPGWYKVIMRYNHNGANAGTLSGAHFSPVLFKNGVVEQIGPAFTTGYGGVGTQTVLPLGFQSVHTVYLVARDFVQAGYSCTAAEATFITGDGSGADNYFSIALLTQNLN